MAKGNRAVPQSGGGAPIPATPADKSKPDKPNKPKRPPSPPRRKNRFNERELARAGRVGKAIGAEKVEVDPASGKISLILPGKGGTTHDPDDLLSKL